MDALLSPEQMAEADRLAAAQGIPTLDLMEAAGRAVAETIVRRFGARPVLVLCGPGMNGGDGFVVARYLKTWGWPVRLALLGDPSALAGDTARMAARWDGGIGAAELGDARLVVDAVFGAGLNREVPRAVAALAAACRDRALPVVSVDLPSGVDGRTGLVRGASFSVATTVTFFRKKPGHVLEPGRSLCGELVLADIGIPASVLDTIRPRVTENVRPRLPIRDTSAHKYRAGHALIVGGGETQTGAARLAAETALRAGAGLVTLALPKAALAVAAAHVTAVMLRECGGVADLQHSLEDRRITALCIGPAAGVTARTRGMALAALARGVPSVFDADALTVFAQDPQGLFRAVTGPLILTPHEGEFARLFRDDGSASSSKIERALGAAQRSGAVVVLKGPDTVIAAPDGRASVNTNGTPRLATAGSGDVLAGLITGLLAQGMPAYEAAAAGVWWHAEAAQRTASGFTADDLPALVSRADPRL